MNRRSREGGLLATRRALAIFAASPVAMVFLLACTPNAKYRVLSFFFDGVPMPGTPADEGQTAQLPGDRASRTGAGKEGPIVREKYYTHTAYAQSRCGSCHNRQTGRLFRSPEEGLCQTCHTDPPGEARFLHGPVAVNACLFCHHPHVGPFPSATLLDLPDLCFQCHEPEDLTSGPHHQTPGQRRCTACHSPHGGNDRFFLKRTEP